MGIKDYIINHEENDYLERALNLNAFPVPLINLMFHFSFQWHTPANHTLKKGSARYIVE